MKIFLILTLSLCAVQCSDILIKVIQEAHIGNCKLGCNQCPQNGNNTLALAQTKLAKLKEEQKALEEDVTEAETTQSSVNNAGNATEDLSNAAQGNRRRRRKRASDTVSLTSCENPSAKIEGDVGTVILEVLAGIKKSLEAISENSLDVTTLKCYILLAVDLTTRLHAGTLNKPSNVTAIVTFSVTVQQSVTTTRTTVVIIVEKRKQALVLKKQEVTKAKQDVIDAGGTVDAGEVNGGLSEPKGTSTTDFMTTTITSERTAMTESVDFMITTVPSQMPCTSASGIVYHLYESWREGCQYCYCQYSYWENRIIKSCYDSYYQYYCAKKPHRDCVVSGKDSSGCCDEYNCDNTTCRSVRGQYYAIGDTWSPADEPCKKCSCHADGNATKTECVTRSCADPPGPNCRPLTRQFQCCPYDWDCSDSYLITTPRKWVRGQKASICVFLLGSPDLRLNFSLKDDSEVVSQVNLEQTAASGYHCVNVTVLSNISYISTLEISGEINNASIFEKRNLILVSIMKTFIQTDKYLYMPGQLVLFRILTITGTKALVSYEDIPEIWIMSPKSKRLAQWKNVPNPDGLLQLDFQLAEEVEEGTYQIFVRTEETSASQGFKVEDYVLPRFSLTIQAPPYVLATASEIVFSVCANYTYGQPVNGTLTLSVDMTTSPYYYYNYYYYYYYYYYLYHTTTRKPPVEKTFSGCDEVSIATADIGYVGYQVTVKGSFVEEGTGNVMTATASVEVKYQSSILEAITPEEYWKPGLPYNFRVKVTKLDSSAAEGEVIKICVRYDSSCKNYTVDESGMINAFIPPHFWGEYINAQTLGGYQQGNLGSLYSSYTSVSPSKFFSPSQSSLSLGLLPKSHECSTGGDTITIPVMFVANDSSSITLHIQVFSRSQITYTSEEVHELTPNGIPISESDLLEPLQPLSNSSLIRGHFDIQVSLGPLTSPHLKVLIWYSRSDGEVISASASADVSKCLRNPTSLRWETKSDALPSPKDDVSLILSSAPGSVCGLGVVDESVELLSGGQRGTPTIGAIFHLFEAAEVSSGENSQVSDYLYCNGNGENSFYDYDYGTEVSGSRKRRPHGYTDMHDALRSFDAAGVYVISDLTLETRPCHYSFTYYYDYESIDYGVGGMTTSGVSEGFFTASQVATHPTTVPDYPYTNGYVDTVSSPGKIELERTYFPETWLWEIVVISQSGETAKDVQVPDTVTKWVGEAVCLHPELGIGLSPKSSITSFVPFFLDLSHPATARRHEKVPVLVSVFNYLTTSLPVTVELLTSADYTAQTYSTKTCVSGSGKEVVKFVVVPLEAGDVNLTFSASIDTTDGSCGGTVDVGRSDTVIRPLKVKFEGITKETTQGHYVCGNESALTWPVESHPGTVNGSDKVSISASADLLGPTLENLGNLIRMPYGCGEQNMLNFAPNIYVMRYLASSGQLTPGVEDQLLSYMKTGYQRELLYQHTDGSFSAFGKSDTSGSTWLTAFVLKSFSQADSYITVDENLLLLSKNWLLALQNGDGCFQSVGSVHNTQMQGSIGYSGESLAPLTAYVLVSLLEGNLTEDVQVIANAVTCITAATSSNTYIDALMAYALSLAGESNATTLISDVYNSLTTGSSGLSQALTVEAAGYLLLAILNENSGSYANWAFDIAKLISTYHNGQGGFVSTQDTVVALQSFAAFSEAFPPSETELTISVTASSQLFEIIIKSENRLVLHTSYITSDLPFDVTVEPSGSGCALVTVTHKYNVYEKPKSSAFTMSVKTDRGDCSSPSSLQICASYTYEDSKSNMAVMEVDLQTGHSAVEEDLRGHVAQQIIKRYEEKDGNVFLYLDSVGASEICISFHIQRDYEVDDILPGTVTLYDYYRPEFTLTQSFETGVCDSK